MIQTGEYGKALTKAMAICGKSEKCRFDIIQKLKKWDLSGKEIEKAVEFLENNHYIDHNRYASAFVNDKTKIQKWGKQKIRFALQQKMIEPHHIDMAINSIDENGYQSNLENILQSKMRVLKFKEKQEAYRKLMQFALGRGYSVGDAHMKIEELLEGLV